MALKTQKILLVRRDEKDQLAVPPLLESAPPAHAKTSKAKWIPTSLCITEGCFRDRATRRAGSPRFPRPAQDCNSRGRGVPVRTCHRVSVNACRPATGCPSTPLAVWSAGSAEPCGIVLHVISCPARSVNFQASAAIAGMGKISTMEMTSGAGFRRHVL